jgi:hypothetical protein
MATGASTEETGEERVMQSSREAIHVAVTVAFIVLCGFLIIFFILFCNSAHLEVPLYLGWGILVVGITAVASNRQRGTSADTSVARIRLGV